jgi:hypothetical protein
MAVLGMGPICWSCPWTRYRWLPCPRKRAAVSVSAAIHDLEYFVDPRIPLSERDICSRDPRSQDEETRQGDWQSGPEGCVARWLDEKKAYPPRTHSAHIVAVHKSDRYTPFNIYRIPVRIPVFIHRDVPDYLYRDISFQHWCYWAYMSGAGGGNVYRFSHCWEIQ